MIWGGTVCLAWGTYESNDNPLLHMRGKAFVHTVELLQQVKTKISEPPTNNIPIKTVSFHPPDRVSFPPAAYNIHGTVSATMEITPCCAIVFSEPEKTKISSEMFLTRRTEGVAGTGSGTTPLSVKHPRQEPFSDLPTGVTIAFRETGLNTRLPTPVFLSASRVAPTSSVETAHAPVFEMRMNIGGAPRLASMAVRLAVMPVDNTRTPISVANTDSKFGDVLKNNIHIAPLRVDAESVLRAWAGNAPASIPSVSVIKFNSVAFPNKEWPMNPLLVSYRPVNISSSANSPANISTGFEIRKNTDDEPRLLYSDKKEIKILATSIASKDNTQPPIDRICVNSRFNSALENDLHITPLNIDIASALRTWTDNALAIVPPIRAIEFTRTAFQNAAQPVNSISVSYRPENVSDSISSTNDARSGFKMRRTSSNAYLPELNEIVIAAKLAISGNNGSSPIEIIWTDNIPGGSSGNRSRAAPLLLNITSLLDAARSALIYVPAPPKLTVVATDNSASSPTPIIPRYSADTFALNKANAAPIRLNGLNTNKFLFVQIRQVILASYLTNSSIRNPCSLNMRQSDPAIPQAIDRILASSIIDEVRSGRLNKRNPEIRMQLVQVLGDNPLGPNSKQIFSMILDNFPGNAARRKIAALQAWAQEYAGGRYAPVLGYYIMHQFYRNKDYDAAIQFADSFLKNNKEYNDRVCFLQALCYAQKNNNTAALNVLQKIRSDFPESPMAPESVFLYAWIFYEEGNPAEAQTILKELVAKYPNTASAGKAAKLLEVINQKNSLTASRP